MVSVAPAAATVVELPCNWRNFQHWLGGGEPSINVLEAGEPLATTELCITLTAKRLREIAIEDGDLAIRDWFVENHIDKNDVRKFAQFSYQKQVYQIERTYLGARFKFEHTRHAVYFKLRFFGN